MALEDRLHPLLSGYVASPQWVKSTLGRLYAAVPKRIRYGRQFPRFQSEVRRCYHIDGLDEAVDAKLMATLRKALTNVPAYAEYRDLLERGLSARSLLARLPLTSKLDIKADPRRYVSTRHGAGDMLEMFTGGSTANPMRFFAHKHVTRPKESAYFEDLDARAGLRPDDVILNLRGRTVPGAGEPGRRLWMFEPIKRHLILSSDHMESRFMPEYVDALREWKPTFVHAYPSALYPLARWLETHPDPDITERIHGIELTSENTYSHQLELFKRVFRCPVIRGYGHTERVLLAATMPDDERYFFWPLYGHIELVDEQGRAITEPGVLGEIVGTSFDNSVMPFVRYRTGDLGAWGVHPHPGLPGFPVLERIEGRLQDFVVCRDRRLISVTTLGAAHFAYLAEVETIQYEQSDPGCLVLKVVCNRDLDERQRTTIRHAVHQKTQGGCEVDVVRVPRLAHTARGKVPMLIQHLDISHFLGSGDDRALADRPGREVSLPAGEFVLMLSTSPLTQGGIAAVVNTYRGGGLFDRVALRLVSTHVDGSRWVKMHEFARALGTTFWSLLTGHVALVHAHVSYGPSFWRKSILLALARAFGKPTIFHLHSGGFLQWAQHAGRVRRAWIRHTMEASDVVVVLTGSWGRRIVEFAPRARLEVLGNPVLLPRAPLLASDKVSAHGGGRVLFLGWIYDFKGCYDLLKAWVLFRQRCPGWRLAVGGKGEVEKFLVEAQRLGVRQDLDFLGWVAGADKDRELRQADVFVLPSYNEGMPVSVLEAMAYGVAVVATPVGGVPDMMVPDVHGLWIQPGDIQGLSDAMATLAMDPVLRARLAAAARDHVMQHSSVQVVSDRLLELYRRLTSTDRAATNLQHPDRDVRRVE